MAATYRFGAGAVSQVGADSARAASLHIVSGVGPPRAGRCRRDAPHLSADTACACGGSVLHRARRALRLRQRAYRTAGGRRAPHSTRDRVRLSTSAASACDQERCIQPSAAVSGSICFCPIDSTTASSSRSVFRRWSRGFGLRAGVHNSLFGPIADAASLRPCALAYGGMVAVAGRSCIGPASSDTFSKPTCTSRRTCCFLRSCPVFWSGGTSGCT